MKKHTQARPALADLIDLLGTKWVMRILWELREQTLTFRALQEACGGLSPSVLNNRLKLLEQNLLLDKRQPSGYALTKQGLALMEVQKPLAKWARGWQKSVLNSK